MNLEKLEKVFFKEREREKKIASGSSMRIAKIAKYVFRETTAGGG